MDMEPEHYTIDELAQESQVKVRNIRYYIAEGLLEPPSERGKYSRSHLLRLRFIRRLSRQFVRLEQIRKALQRTDMEIEALLKATPTEDARLAAESVPLPEDTPGEQARRYIAQALGRVPAAPAALAARETFEAASPVLAEEEAVFGEVDARRAFAAPRQRKMRQAAAPSQEAEGENYQRIVLEDGLELHVRAPITPERQALIAQLIALVEKPRAS
jgi:DNA-binding transcriptional MerR regulator